MNVQVEIDSGSGFCFGVTTAIRKAEEELSLPKKVLGDRCWVLGVNGLPDTSLPPNTLPPNTLKEQLYCLGDIVHNGMEVERLHRQGLVTIDHQQLQRLHGAKVLLRAHGEPPETYETARRNNIQIIDATCPVVLALQRRIKRQYDANPQAQIVIFGKNGHAEVLGLVGQTHQHAIVVESLDDVKRKLDFGRDIYLYSQTTKSLDEYRHIIDYIKNHIAPDATFKSFDTICRQVANRMPNIADFAARHDLILFVSGRKSSNGHALFTRCKAVNPNSHLIENAGEIDYGWFNGVKTVGICGATSTPKWLMEECRDAILNH